MVSQEFSGWQSRIKDSFIWTEDENVRLNDQGVMYYVGGNSGSYMKIGNDGLLTAGTYDDGFEQIGDATFKVQAEKKYNDFDEAFSIALNIGGEKFLNDMFNGEIPSQPILNKNKTQHDIEYRSDFLCDQTDGFPTSLVVDWTTGKANLELNTTLTEDGKDISYFENLCKEWGIRPCYTEEDYNELLKSLGEDAYESAAFDLSEDEQNFWYGNLK